MNLKNLYILKFSRISTVVVSITLTIQQLLLKNADERIRILFVNSGIFTWMWEIFWKLDDNFKNLDMNLKILEVF